MVEELSIYYFAYGSNMDPKQMQEERCPGSEYAGICTLKGYKFLINANGVATIVPDYEKIVHGVLWHINSAHKKTLDFYEGIAENHYYEKTISVQAESLESVSAIAYIANESRPGEPREGYLEKILRGAEHFSLPEQYREELLSWCKRD